MLEINIKYLVDEINDSQYMKAIIDFRNDLAYDRQQLELLEEYIGYIERYARDFNLSLGNGPKV